jgi:hypothetical protein
LAFPFFLHLINPPGSGGTGRALDGSFGEG